MWPSGATAEQPSRHGSARRPSRYPCGKHTSGKGHDMRIDDDEAGAVPPSDELLGEAARRVAEAYPGLYAHQRTGIAFLLARRRAILADDMGLGKTRQAIVA